MSFLWKGGGTQDPAAQDLACLSSRRKDKQPGPGEHGWLGLACLFYLKKVSGPWAAGCGACLFFRGEKRQWALVKPGLACLFYLKSCSPLGVPDSRIGGGEKTACLSFLSKELQGCSPQVLDREIKNPRHFCRGFSRSVFNATNKHISSFGSDFAVSLLSLKFQRVQ